MYFNISTYHDLHIEIYIIATRYTQNEYIVFYNVIQIDLP